MFPIAATIFIASVLGSFHCAGMCGAFLALAGQGAARQWQAQAAYHAGRLVTYVALGAAAGTAGKLLNLAGVLVGLSRTAAVIAGAFMIVFAAVTLMRTCGVHLGRVKLPAFWTRLIQRAHRMAMDRPPLARAAAIGLLTTLLPCGWLYAFAVTAAGTGNPLSGGAAMAVFWAGTLPMLVALGAGVRGVLGGLGRRAPLVTALLVASAGLYTLVGRASLSPAALVWKVSMTHAGHPACCHTTDGHDTGR